MQKSTQEIRTPQDRGILATAKLRSVLGIDDIKLLSFALAEVAADEADRNKTFAERVRAKYQEFALMKGENAKQRKKTQETLELTPITTDENFRLDPYAKLDPYLVKRIYGTTQLRQAMSRFTLEKLKETIPFVQEHHPGTKPKTKSRKDDIIDYIIQYVGSE